MFRNFYFLNAYVEALLPYFLKKDPHLNNTPNLMLTILQSTVKFCDKERFDKEQIGVKEPFPVTNCQFTTSG